MESASQVRLYFKPTDQVVPSDLPLWKAWQIMRSTGATLLPVVEDNLVIGTISHDDLVNASRMGESENRSVVHGMARDPIFARSEDNIETVVDKMIQLRRAGAVVIDENSQVLGVLSIYDALRALHQALREA